ncbi:hypothetical protein HYALB_00002956 [Hymenoscyphus albidus]|uniref:Cytochrome P450 n=1 Tax=Hymenoscyphus albidus TaxID=595503 RepID=A0A9N9QDX1_9HELO|nr:hypothetical protein HYALB_00002956 [Hymenoscyphus albidus]
MPDDFYDPVTNVTISIPPWSTRLWESVKHPDPNVLLAMVLGPLLMLLITRYLSGRPREGSGKERSAWMLPYWIPFLGHGFHFLWDPVSLFKEAREQSPHSIFSLYLGGTTHNIISDPKLVQRFVMAQRESHVQFTPVARTIVQRFFGLPKSSKEKYDKAWEELNSSFSYIARDPFFGTLLNGTVKNIENNVSHMISFVDTAIDLEPWEKWGNASYISDEETEIDFAAMIRDVMGHCSVPVIYGSAFIEKFPNVLHDVYEMDKGMPYFLMGFPSWFPWPSVLKAHIARNRVWQALDDQQRAFDDLSEGKEIDYSWGDLDDVSDFSKRRHEIYRKYGFEVRERGEFTTLWALIINSSLLVYWHLLYILSTPDLLSRLRTEIAPYATVEKPLSIGKISEAPRLSINHEGLAKNCHLFKSTYFEALRLTDQPWSVRKVSNDVVISGDGGEEEENGENGEKYVMREGEYITMPHDLHMRDPIYFVNPEKFEPERFLERDEEGNGRAEMGSIRPYGGGVSQCKGRGLAERECISLVAGIIAFWDIELVDKKKGWVVPPQVKTTAVARPLFDTRVRIRRRKFEWEV